MLQFITSFPTLLHSAIIFGTVIMLGALGEILTEKSGNLNLGVPGIMYIGAIASLTASYYYEVLGGGTNKFTCLVLSLIACLVASALAGLIYSFLTITLRTNQNVTGLTLTIFGGGVGNFFGSSLTKIAGGQPGQIKVPITYSVYAAYPSGLVTKLDALAPKVGFGTLLFSYGFLTYVAIIIAIVMNYFFRKTRAGLCLRAVGENTATADAAGINITAYKYLATCIGAAISGLGGSYYVMSYIGGTWESLGTIEALGWLAVALVIFTTWKPLRAIWGAYLFGVLYWAFYYIPGLTRSDTELFKMLPYIATVIILMIVSFRRKPEDQPPASLGLPYFREER